MTFEAKPTGGTPVPQFKPYAIVTLLIGLWALDSFSNTRRNSSISEVTLHGGKLFKKVFPYILVFSRGSRTASTPRSVVLRMRRPSPCFRLITACGTLYS